MWKMQPETSSTWLQINSFWSELPTEDAWTKMCFSWQNGTENGLATIKIRILWKYVWQNC